MHVELSDLEYMRLKIKRTMPAFPKKIRAEGWGWFSLSYLKSSQSRKKYPFNKGKTVNNP